MVKIVVDVASWLAVFLVLGSIWYLVDRIVGVPIYRWWYALTHRDPLPADILRGFIHGQRARVRFIAAVVLSVLQSSLVLASVSISNPLAELIGFCLEVPVVMGGFYLGPWLFRLWERKEHVFERVDRLESGEISLKAELKEAGHKAAEAVRGALGVPEKGPGAPASKTPAVPAAAPDTKEPELSAGKDNQAAKPEPNWNPRDLINKYIRRG